MCSCLSLLCTTISSAYAEIALSSLNTFAVMRAKVDPMLRNLSTILLKQYVSKGVMKLVFPRLPCSSKFDGNLKSSPGVTRARNWLLN